MGEVKSQAWNLVREESSAEFEKSIPVMPSHFRLKQAAVCGFHCSLCTPSGVFRGQTARCLGGRHDACFAQGSKVQLQALFKQTLEHSTVFDCLLSSLAYSEPFTSQFISVESRRIRHPQKSFRQNSPGASLPTSERTIWA